MNRIPAILTVLIFGCLAYNLNGQQLPVYSQYMMNGFLLNPAVAGHEGYTNINITGREQWLGTQKGVTDAPSTYAASGQTRLLRQSYMGRGHSVKRRRASMSRSGRVGLGGYIYSDWSGVFNRSGAAFSYAYHIPMYRSQLSFGASLTGYQFRIDPDKIRLYEESAIFGDMATSALIPDANFGAYYTDKNIYAGFSALQLFENTLKLNNTNEIGYKMERHYYLMAGYRFDLVDFVFMEPSFLLKATESLITQIDINGKFYFKEDYWAGLSYRSGGSYTLAQESISGGGSSIIIMGGAKVDKFYFGYAFDYTLASIRKYSLGSHELMLAMKFGDNARRYRWLNRY